jgi:hypothetical protein
MRTRRNAYKVLTEKLEGKRPLEDIGEGYLKEYDGRMWTGFICLKIVGFCQYGNESSASMK